METYARLFLKSLYGYRRQEQFHLHALVLMPEHVHLLLTPAPDVTLERVVQLIKGGYSYAFGLEFGMGRFGKEVLLITTSAMMTILPGIAITFIRTP